MRMYALSSEALTLEVNYSLGVTAYRNISASVTYALSTRLLLPLVIGAYREWKLIPRCFILPEAVRYSVVRLSYFIAATSIIVNCIRL